MFVEKAMLKASEVVEISPGLRSFFYWRPYMIWWLPSHIFLSLIYLVYLLFTSHVHCTFVVPLFCMYIYRTAARVYERLYCNYFKWNSRIHEGLFDLWWPNWNIYCYGVLTFDITLTNVLIFLLCFHFSAYRKLARSYHPDVNKWVLFPLFFFLCPLAMHAQDGFLL